MVETGSINDSMFSRIPELAREALERNRDHISECREACYNRRRDRRHPLISLIGPSRSGKDLAAAYICGSFAVEFSASTSTVLGQLISSVLDESFDTVFGARHQNRQFWFEFGNELRRDNPALISEMVLAKNDLLVGTRAAVEFAATISAGLSDVSVWVENSRAVKDPTLEVDKDDCDVVVVNNSTRFAYYQRLHRLCKALGMQPRQSRDGAI